MKKRPKPIDDETIPIARRKKRTNSKKIIVERFWDISCFNITPHWSTHRKYADLERANQAITQLKKSCPNSQFRIKESQ